jgi:hypothetical protein
MSFSVEFTARNKAAARKQVEAAHLPEPVRAFLLAGVANLPAATEERPRVIRVKATGHLCTGGDYEVSSGQLEVIPVPLLE